MKIDLHGLSINEATAKIMTALDEFDYTLEIITGKGTGALRTLAENIAIQENYEYENIEGGILVKK